MTWSRISYLVDCGLVLIDQTGNKRLRLNRLDAWWTVDWYWSIKQRTNAYALTGLTLGGLWTGMDRPFPLIVQVKITSSARLQSTTDWLIKSRRPAHHNSSRIDCSSQDGQLSMSSASSVRMIDASWFHAPGTDELIFSSRAAVQKTDSQ
jgi:hypothetical protein